MHQAIWSLNLLMQKTGNVLDILDCRNTYTVKNHFIVNYILKERNNVETVRIDIEAGYVHVILAIFPQKRIIIDQFHLINPI